MIIEKIIPDTSVIIECILSNKVPSEYNAREIIIHEALLAELEHQANLGKASGRIGLEELQKLREIAEKQNISFRYGGRRPTAGEIRFASLGEIDALIRQLAWEEGATLVTADTVQSEVAKAHGIPIIFIPKKIEPKPLKLEQFFDEQTMSVHIREDIPVNAKRGRPGNWKFVQVTKKPLSHEEIKEISREILEEAKARKDGFIEIEREGSTIIQLGNYRIVICRPPFSDAWEITAVRPVKKLSLEDYGLSQKLMDRILSSAEGILVAGAPGNGKTTFAQALAEFYASKEKIVKTVEAPRDMILSDNITQYAISHGSIQEIHDILLLSRPDYTVFDEMRNTPDFELFGDLRLAGVGMVGIVHATNPIDAIQRFIGRVEMGVIPQIIDTVLFIKNGTVAAVLSLEMTVKVPTGMTEADLARPVVVVTDFESGKLVYEIYTYGEQTVVIPVDKIPQAVQKGGIKDLATKQIEREFMKYAREVKVEVLGDNKVRVFVPEKDIPTIIGKQGQNIDKIEEKLGLSIDVVAFGELPQQTPPGEVVSFSHEITKKAVIFYLGEKYANADADIYVNNEYLMSAHCSMKGTINVSRKNNLGRLLTDALNSGEKIEIRV